MAFRNHQSHMKLIFGTRRLVHRKRWHRKWDIFVKRAENIRCRTKESTHPILINSEIVKHLVLRAQERFLWSIFRWDRYEHRDYASANFRLFFCTFLIFSDILKYLIFDAIFCDGPISDFRKFISCAIGGFESPLHVVSRTVILHMHINECRGTKIRQKPK